jgi:hypothetical protein
MKTNHKVIHTTNKAIMHNLLHESISREIVGVTVTCSNSTALHVELGPQVHLMHTECNLGMHAHMHTHTHVSKEGPSFGRSTGRI